MDGGQPRQCPPYYIPASGAAETQSNAKEIYQYDAPWPIYALDWCKIPNERKGFRLALGSFVEEDNNKLQVISRTDILDNALYPTPSGNTGHPLPDFTTVSETSVYYPITKVMWEPWKNDSCRGDLLATTGDALRIWELLDHPHYGIANNSINSSTRRSSPSTRHSKQPTFCAPLTSFDWNEADPSLIVTSSIDTTCTLWNIETNQAKTQLIAHDSDVYDVAFMHGSTDMFASVGADGSVRMFDLRSLEHSTILYEAPSSDSMPFHPASNPLLRLQFNRTNTNLIATFHMDSSSVIVIDIRHPSTPFVELNKNNPGCINGISWAPGHAGQLCTGDDDGQVLVWDIQQTLEQTPRSHQQQQPQSQHQHTTRYIHDPALVYSAKSEVNSLSWSKGVPNWIAVGFGKTLQALRV
ncbi:WD40-repeat-containing domain protein [Dichotomocladium elegans]|nr:WD40-repeat-containing domain protein [Dichotomocladium elegans]